MKKVLWEGSTWSGHKSALVMEDGVIREKITYSDGVRGIFPLDNFLDTWEEGWFIGPPLSEESKELIKQQLAIEELKR